MTQFVFFILCVTIILSCGAELECEINEVEDSCPTNCGTDFCPENENYDRSCEKLKECPEPACKCKFNFSRANNGSCVPTRQCPAFLCSRLNEEYVSCPPSCPSDDCSQANPDGRCPMFVRIGIVLVCQPACRCKKGYWRNEGICVPYNECHRRDEGNALPYPFVI